MMKTVRFLAISLTMSAVLALVLSGQEEGKHRGKESAFAELAKVPERYRLKENPLSHDSEAPAAGAVLFEEHCEECHGRGALGGRRAPNLRAPEVQAAEPGSLFYILSNGVVRKGMPVWSKLPDPQRWQLVSYIKSLGIAGGEGNPTRTNKP